MNRHDVSEARRCECAQAEVEQFTGIDSTSGRKAGERWMQEFQRQAIYAREDQADIKIEDYCTHNAMDGDAAAIESGVRDTPNNAQFKRYGKTDIGEKSGVTARPAS